jgi:hypothetical protein
MAALVTIEATAGKRFRGTIATFHASNAKVKDFHASINWGDQSGNTSGRIKSLGGGRFAVLATHRFGATGSFQITVSVADQAGQPVAVTGSGVVQAGKRK